MQKDFRITSPVQSKRTASFLHRLCLMCDLVILFPPTQLSAPPTFSNSPPSALPTIQAVLTQQPLHRLTNIRTHGSAFLIRSWKGQLWPHAHDTQLRTFQRLPRPHSSRSYLASSSPYFSSMKCFVPRSQASCGTNASKTQSITC
jgi:hypothetical protein